MRLMLKVKEERIKNIKIKKKNRKTFLIILELKGSTKIYRFVINH